MGMLLPAKSYAECLSDSDSNPKNVKFFSFFDTIVIVYKDFTYT